MGDIGRFNKAHQEIEPLREQLLIPQLNSQIDAAHCRMKNGERVPLVSPLSRAKIHLGTKQAVAI